MSDLSSVGVMEGAFFVSRSELLAWLAKDFNLNVTKVEQCASGAVYCQIVDMLFPGKVPMQKVKWDAKLEYQYITNYKILQQVFDKLDVKKSVDVDKLIKGKYQDNLEFLQWMKAFHDRVHVGEQPYDPLERRLLSRCELPDWAKAGTKGALSMRHPGSNSKTVLHEGGVPLGRKGSTSLGGPSNSNQILIKELKEENANMLKELETAERERDFYFGKLQALEIICQQEDKEHLAIHEVQQILYAEEEAEKEEA